MKLTDEEVRARFERILDDQYLDVSRYLTPPSRRRLEEMRDEVNVRRRAALTKGE